ncbi:hypothetical protein BDZ97DRAFT_1791532 [Flammula alnicola]|nr:hypothetical protein BDZ97DRAFT_1791532 [Flammula alnicola]
MTSQIDLIRADNKLTFEDFYCAAFPKDRFLLKTVIYAVYMLESAQTLLLSVDAFKMFAIGFGNSTSFAKLDLHSGWFSIPIMSGIIACFSQGFYTYRIFVVSQSRYIPGVILLLSLFQLGGAIAIGLQAKRAPLIAGGIWAGGSAACDIMIAACMTYYLRRRDTGFKKTRDILTKIIVLTIETGTVTATLAIIVMVLAILPDHLLYWVLFVMVLGKVYSNSMMVALNSRMKVFPNASRPVWNEDRTLFPSARHEGTLSLREDVVFAPLRPVPSNDTEHPAMV